MSILIKGKFEEKLQFIFVLFDLEEDGVLTQDILRRFIMVIHGKEMWSKVIIP